MIGHFMSRILWLEAVFMLPSVIICLHDGDYGTGIAFLISIGVAIAVGGILALLGKSAGLRFQAREGLVCVGLSWIVLSLVG